MPRQDSGELEVGGPVKPGDSSAAFTGRLGGRLPMVDEPHSLKYASRFSSREVRIRVPLLFSVVYFSRGPSPKKKTVKGHPAGALYPENEFGGRPCESVGVHVERGGEANGGLQDSGPRPFGLSGRPWLAVFQDMPQGEWLRKAGTESKCQGPAFQRWPKRERERERERM